MRVLLITRHMPGARSSRSIAAAAETRSSRRCWSCRSCRRSPDRRGRTASEGEAIEPPPNVGITYVRFGRLHRWLWKHREARNPFAAVFLLIWTAFVLVREALRLTRTQRYD